MVKKLLSMLLVASMCMSVPVLAEDNSARIAEIEAQIAELKELKGETGAEEGEVLFEDDSVSIIYDGIDEDFMGYEIKFIIENKTDKTLLIQARETSINGFMVTPMFSAEVAPHKKSKDGISILGDDAEDNPIENVESIETKFYVANSNDWGEHYETDFVTIM